MKTITLSKPLQIGDTSVSELTFNEASVGDLVVGSTFKTDMANTAAVLASMAGIPLPAFHKIGASDFKKIMADPDVSELMGNDRPDTTKTGG